MKFIVALILCTSLIYTSTTFGQERSIKITIIKKIKDSNGKIKIETKQATGEDAKILIKELCEDESLDEIDIEVEIEEAIQTGKSVKKVQKEDITIEKSIDNGVESTMYKMILEENGKKKVLIWNGDGEMPSEMAKKLEQHNIQTEIIGEGQEMKITIDSDDIDKYDYDDDMHIVEKRIYIEQGNNNKVTLGVLIEDDRQGVVVSKILEDSSAQKAGIKSGDTILKVNNTYVFNSDMLLDALSEYDKGAKVMITYLRDGKELKTEVEF